MSFLEVYWSSNIQARSAEKKRIMQPQTDEQRGKRAYAFTATGSFSKAVKGLVGRATQGSVDCRKNWTTALIPRALALALTLPMQNVTRQRVVLWGGDRYKAARSAMREQGRSKTCIASLPHVQLACSVNVMNIWTQSSPSLVPGRGGVCFEALTFSRLNKQFRIFQKYAASSSTRSSCS